VEIALAKGKKQYDRRETIKRRIHDRESSAAIKRSTRRADKRDIMARAFLTKELHVEAKNETGLLGRICAAWLWKACSLPIFRLIRWGTPGIYK